jgi:ribulose-phosphate 3-epimerase
MIKLSPSILSADFSNLLTDITAAEEAGVDLLHIDVMDGHFVPNISLGPVIMNSIKGKTSLPFDVHLMIENPDKYVPEFVQGGADIITVHVETCPHIHRTIQNIKSYGIKAGVSLNPGTSLHAIEEVLEEIDMVLIMSVNPGFGGQKFIEGSLRKISELRKMIDSRGLDIDIEVDGGVKVDNVSKIIDAGANVIVAGSAIFNGNNIKENVLSFKEKFKEV